jgi:hypothetical protein
VFRLDTGIQGCAIYLTINGELKKESVDIVESACLKALTEHAQVTILIDNITEFDQEGFALLMRLISAKVRVQAKGLYSQYVLNRAELLSTSLP